MVALVAFVVFGPLLIVFVLAFVGCQFRVRGFAFFGMADDVPVPGRYLAPDSVNAALFRPAQNLWLILDTSLFVYIDGTDSDPVLGGRPPGVGNVLSFSFGQPGDVLVPGDYDGAGLTQPAVFRPSDGNWYVATIVYDRSNMTLAISGVRTFASPFGPGELSSSNGDFVLPPGDYLGDGTRRVAAFKALRGEWHLRDLMTQATQVVTFGQPGDLPLAGDYDGDGIVRPAVVRPATGTLHVFDVASNREREPAPFPFKAQDVPFGPAGYLGVAARSVAIFRPSEGSYFFFDQKGNPERGIRVVGDPQASDVPAPAAYDDPRLVEEVIFRPGNGSWYRPDFTVYGGS
jgi:hypothetical protein